MKNTAVLPLLLLLLPALAISGELPDQPSNCSLSVYTVDSKTGSLGERVISPEQVSSIKLAQSTIIEAGSALKVSLTPAGASANKKYTSKHIGEKLAILCNGQEVTRVTIAGRSAGTFVIEGIEWP